ncbi:hypothetical protein [Flavobacterium sp. DSP2-3-1]|uniref:hypothetical protein n=1 Tax=Flavobacterium sp. DSP2-3-1 TaxID=2804620 RepID=UPI003CEE6469
MKWKAGISSKKIKRVSGNRRLLRSSQIQIIIRARKANWQNNQKMNGLINTKSKKRNYEH